MKNKDYKIYSLKCPKTLEVRYVGVTTTTLSRRLHKHLYETKTSKISHKINWLKKLDEENLIPIIELIEICDVDNWQEREIYWINSFENLTNTHKGGSHVYLKEKNNSLKKIKVYQYDLNGNYINSFDSLTEAAKEVNKSVSSLQRALSCDKGSCANFQWKTIKLDKIEKFYPETKTRMKVFKLVPVEYKDFDSIQEMTEELNLSYGAVISAMNENRSCKGYMFEKIKI